jgi:hypothetical protein
MQTHLALPGDDQIRRKSAKQLDDGIADTLASPAATALMAQ